MELSDPVSRLKLQATCSALKNALLTQTQIVKVYLEEKEILHTIACSFLGGVTIFTGRPQLEYEKNIYQYLTEHVCYLMPDNLYLRNLGLTKTDLKYFTTGDPTSVSIIDCNFLGGLTFEIFLEAFPYAEHFYICGIPNLPKTWIDVLISAKRNTDLKSLYLEIAEEQLQNLLDNVNKFFTVSSKEG